MHKTNEGNPKGKVILIILSVIILMHLIVSSSIIYVTTKSQFKKDLLENELPTISMRSYLEISNELSLILKASETIANDLFVLDWIETGEKDKRFMQEYLKSIKDRHNAITCFLASDISRTYYDLNGYFQLSENDPDASWYFDIKNEDNISKINISINSDMNDIPTAFINYKIFNEQKEFLGIAGLGISLESIPKIISNYNLEKDKDVYFINSSGAIVAKSTNTEISNINDLSIVDEDIKNIFNSNVGIVEFEELNNKYVLYSRFIEEFDWWFVIVQNETAIMKSRNQILVSVFIISIITVLVTLVLILVAVKFYDKKMFALIITDKLTDVFNRRFFEIILNKALSENRREKRDICLFIIDIDFFKKINDSMGHLAGDKVLINVVNIISQSKRASDDLCRWGGEEFALLLYDCSVKQGEVLAEKIRSCIEYSCIEQYPNGQNLTISIGITPLRLEDSMDSFIKRADTALYKAKENGRNCVITNY